jgi:hypothetical protein
MHNGISALESNCGNFATMVVKKGAILALPGQTSIVANDCASDTAGCTIITNTNNEIVVRDSDIHQILEQVRNGKTSLVSLTHPVFSCVRSLPHGAGRDNAAGDTYRSVMDTGILSVFMKLMQKTNLTVSFSPDTANDMPGKAYRSQNLAAYESESIKMFSIRTIGNFKEGINRMGFGNFLKLVEELINSFKSVLLSFARRLQTNELTLVQLTSYDDVMTEEQLLFKIFICLDLILIHNFAKDNTQFALAMILKGLCLQKLLGDEGVTSIYLNKLPDSIAMIEKLLGSL